MTSSGLGKNDDTTNFATKQRQIEKGAWWGGGGGGVGRREVKNARKRLKKYVSCIPTCSYSISTLKVNFHSSLMGYILNNSTAELNYLLFLS